MGNHWKIIGKPVNVTGNLLENLLKPVENHEKHMKPIQNYGQTCKTQWKTSSEIYRTICQTIGKHVKHIENS